MLKLIMYNFTPFSALLGGVIIGFSVAIFFFTTGRLAGISGIFANSITSKKNWSSNILFLIGLIIGPLFYLNINKLPSNFEITNYLPLIILGGFLVGFGTRIGGGCTSGHGICGISKFSSRSIIATLIFIISGILTVYTLQLFGFYL